MSLPILGSIFGFLAIAAIVTVVWILSSSQSSPAIVSVQPAQVSEQPLLEAQTSTLEQPQLASKQETPTFPVLLRNTEPMQPPQQPPLTIQQLEELPTTTVQLPTTTVQLPTTTVQLPTIVAQGPTIEIPIQRPDVEPTAGAIPELPPYQPTIVPQPIASQPNVGNVQPTIDNVVQPIIIRNIQPPPIQQQMEQIEEPEIAFLDVEPSNTIPPIELQNLNYIPQASYVQQNRYDLQAIQLPR